MSRRSRRLFLILVIAQAAHSVEEYVTRLYDVFAPARFVSGLVSDDLAVGFAIINVAIVAVGVWCYLGPVRSGGDAAWLVAWVPVPTTSTVTLGRGVPWVPFMPSPQSASWASSW